MTTRSTTEKLLVYVTPEEKRLLQINARMSGVSVSQYIIRATTNYQKTMNESAFIETMIDQMNEATDKAMAAVDDTLKFVDESNKRISLMESRRT